MLSVTTLDPEVTGMANATALKQARLVDEWDAIVIGSGIGGLTGAVLLGRYGGKRVLVLERHYEAGGFTHTFHRPGYEWDVGLHYIGQMQEDSRERRAFDHVTGGQVRWQPMPQVYDRVFIEAGSSSLRRGSRDSRRAEGSLPRRSQGYRPLHCGSAGMQPGNGALQRGEGGPGAGGGAGREADAGPLFALGTAHHPGGSPGPDE